MASARASTPVVHPLLRPAVRVAENALVGGGTNFPRDRQFAIELRQPAGVSDGRGGYNALGRLTRFDRL